ncbi:MAG TPA: hypothetical protein VK501_19890 [Baekduia sp.]|uniref:hypothetical protein n=1 Tax=Baekduia sp. TaxID=2600305 RepID=UPI002C4C96FB|nr:hypothetical protein [Baekduia sp.]HMJ36172.1 hypothetical protein [Baekduia sp.]
MATPDIATGTATGLMAFMDFMIAKGYGTAGSINPWKSAAKNVFTVVEGDEFGELDVRTFDVDEYLGRFENRAMGKYTADSLAAYRSRFRKAIDAYRSYLADPNWRPAVKASARRPVTENGSKSKVPRGSEAASDPSPAPLPPASPALIAYPFPLKSGQLAQLHLPTQLDRDDADRLTNFIRALVFDQPRQLPSGGSDGE